MIYVTREDVASEAASSFETIQGTEVEKGASSLYGDVEKGKEGKPVASAPMSDSRKGRPDSAHLVADCVSRCSLGERIGVDACDPLSLIEATREAVFRKDFDMGPSITFHSDVSCFWMPLMLCARANVRFGIRMVKKEMGLMYVE